MDRLCFVLVVTGLLLYSAEESVSVCSQQINSSFGTIQPPKGRRNVNCTYVINNPTGDPVILRFLHVNIQNSPGCVKNYIEVKDGTENTDEPVRFCGNSIPRPIFAVSGVLTLTLISESPVDSNTFKAEFYSCSDCIKRINSTDQSLEYFSDPNREPLVTDFVYLIENDRPVILKFTSINLDKSKDCTFEYVQIKRGTSFNSPEVGTYCGNDIPKPTVLPPGQFSIVYHTEEPFGNHGFTLYFYEDNSTQSLPIPSQVLEGRGKYVEERTSKTAIYVISTVGFCIATVFVVNGLIIWKRRSRQKRNKVETGLDKYATLQKKEQNPTADYENENINIIYNPNYVVTGSPDPCVITKIENVHSSTPSILDDDSESPSNNQSVKSNGDADADYALEEGSYYVLNIASKNKALVSGKMDDKKERKKSQEYADVGFEEDSRLHSMDTPDKMFEGVTLKISDIHHNL
ncbi:cubilin-like [Mytilus trossulus]|uniref:cubilin-like n=1 Tax=Mytilus trossulus TaxID=6551 RepID=UPI0030046087